MSWYKCAKKIVGIDALHFEPSPYWGKSINIRQANTQPSATSTDDPSPYEDALSERAKFEGGVADLFGQHNPGKNVMGFDSLYIGPSGSIFMLRPHSHDDTARSVLRSVDPSLPAMKPDAGPSKTGGYTHTDLTLESGIQRVQMYRDGMGVTVEMANPPNKRQLRTIKQMYEMTPMDRFAAEIDFRGETIGVLTSFRDLVYFVNHFDPKNPGGAPDISPKMQELYEQFKLP